MSKCVIACLPQLHELAHSSPKKRKLILQSANTKIIRSIVECIQNVLKGNIQMQNKNIQKLRRHKTVLRNIIHKGNRLKKKKQIILQKGGSFLPALLAPIIGVLANRLIG